MEKEIAKLTADKEKETKAFESLSGFAIIKKSQAKKQIAYLQGLIDEKKAGLADAQKKKDGVYNSIDYTVQSQKPRLEKEINGKLPFPRKPRMPEPIATDKLTAIQIANWCLKRDIYDYLLTQNAPKNVDDVLEGCESVDGLSHQKVNALLAQMVREDMVRSFTQDRRTYYVALEE